MATRSGYSIVIRGFVEVDPKNLAKHQEALAAINLATSGDKDIPDLPGSKTDALFRLMEVEEFAVRPVQRQGEQS